MEAKKNPSNKDLAIMKILKQQGHGPSGTTGPGGKKRKRTKSATTEKTVDGRMMKTSAGLTHNQLHRRQSYPPPTNVISTGNSVQSNVSSIASSFPYKSGKIPGGYNNTSATTFTTMTSADLVAQQQKRLNKDMVELELNKNKMNIHNARKIQYINTYELPPLAEGKRTFQRRSSFTLRKNVDNDLGYEGRRRHRHSWQDRRQADYFSYSYGAEPSDSD